MTMAMRNTVFTFLLIALWVSSAGAAERGIQRIRDFNHGASGVGTYKALVIGIDDYRDPNIPDLDTAVADARAVAEVLENQYGFQTDLLLNREVSRSNLYNALRGLASNAGPKDSVLIYYAGHGELDRLYDDGWWVPADATGGDPTTYLDNVQVQKAMRSTQARHVLLISDSCYSGTLFGRKTRAIPQQITEKYYLDLYRDRSRWGITSGNLTPVSDIGAAGHSLFAYQLLKTLCGNDRPYLSTQEVYTRIAPVIANNAEQTPMCRPVKNTNDMGGEFVFIRTDNRPPREACGIFLADSGGTEIVEPIAPRRQQPAYGELLVQTNVRDASVYLDGRKLGTGSLRIKKMRPGGYKVKVDAGGYEPYEKTVTVAAGQSHTLQAYLERTAVEPVVEPVAPVRNEPEPGDLVDGPLPGMKFAWIPPGSFMMGSPADEPGRDDDETQHRVTLTKGFYMGTTEVTQGQWKAVMGSNPSRFKDCGDDCPVEKVSWNDVQEFIQKLNRREGETYRLPTEAEWEYAARAGTETAYHWGDEADCSKANYGNGWSNECKGKNPGETMQVGSFPANKWGLYDMHGNVWEWCADWHGDYPSGSVTDPAGPLSGSYRVGRGGSWYDSAGGCRSANRRGNSPGYRFVNIGFRLVLSPGQ